MLYEGHCVFVRCMPCDWVGVCYGVCYSLKKEDGVWLISKDLEEHMSFSTRQKPGAFVVPAPIWSAAFVCPALWLW